MRGKEGQNRERKGLKTKGRRTFARRRKRTKSEREDASQGQIQLIIIIVISSKTRHLFFLMSASSDRIQITDLLAICHDFLRCHIETLLSSTSQCLSHMVKRRRWLRVGKLRDTAPGQRRNPHLEFQISFLTPHTRSRVIPPRVIRAVEIAATREQAAVHEPSRSSGKDNKLLNMNA
ncbi:hypothetical protein F2P81_025408 [Scophthalmus maximus]|uniref:Uncharacterized protein n=1 Tax=Scophthalmus maximus TaxID=52904 RepID=A0A6A4RKG4_SCOMX|nr:hypothetical protein F2P81_025408 [Scophthalmus maximus]